MAGPALRSLQASKTWCSATSPRGEAQPACSSTEGEDDAHQNLAHVQAAPLRDDRHLGRLPWAHRRNADRGISAQRDERATYFPAKLARQLRKLVAGAGRRSHAALQRTRAVVLQSAEQHGHGPRSEE